MLSINMLGKVNISYNGVNITDQLSTKLVALICLLVLNSKREMSRDRLAAYLWPDSDEEAARYNMRYNLWKVKKFIPPHPEGQSFIRTMKDSCRINEKYPFQCDKLCIDGFDSHSPKSVEELLKLKELFKGDFLEGLYLKNCNEFNEIILFERVVCQTKQIEIMKRLIQLYEETEQSEEELQILQEMMAIEPYNENFVYRILNIYKSTGNRAAAINYYRIFESKLRRELNIAPNNELKLLYRTVAEDSCGRKDDYSELRHMEKKKLIIRSRCMRNVDFFWVADVVGGLLDSADTKYLLDFNPNYILDLSYIQNELLPFYEKHISKEQWEAGSVPPVRIVNAFLKFLNHFSHFYRIHIHIENSSEMDPSSVEILKYIQACASDNIRIEK